MCFKRPRVNLNPKINIPIFFIISAIQLYQLKEIKTARRIAVGGSYSLIALNGPDFFTARCEIFTT